MTYQEVANVLGITYDTVETDVRYIRKFISGFAEGGELKIRELAYYVCFRGEVNGTNGKNKREQGIRELQQAIKRDIDENLPYNDLTFFV